MVTLAYSTVLNNLYLSQVNNATARTGSSAPTKRKLPDAASGALLLHSLVTSLTSRQVCQFVRLLRADVSQAKSLSRAGVSQAANVPRLGAQLMALGGVGRPPMPLGAPPPSLALQQQMAAARFASLGAFGGLQLGPLGLPAGAVSAPGGATNLAAALLSLQSSSNPFSLPALSVSGLSSLVTPPPAQSAPSALQLPFDASLLAGAAMGVGMGGGLAVGDLLKQLQMLQAAAAPPASANLNVNVNPLLSALAMALPQNAGAPSIPTPPATSQASRAPAAPNVAPSLLAQMQSLFNLSGGGGGGGGGGGLMGLGGNELALSQLAALGLAGQPFACTSAGGGGGLPFPMLSLDAYATLMQPVALDSLSK